MGQEERSLRVIALAAMTADGKIARSASDPIDWTAREDKRMFVATTKRAGVVVMGRATFANLPKPLPGRLQIVLTSTPERYEPIPGAVEYERGTPTEVLARVRQRGYSEVVVGGGAAVYREYIEAGVVDELWLTIEPLLFGVGLSLCDRALPDVKLRLLETAHLTEQVLQLKYAVLRPA